jgi:PAS domain S-box-containing protein
MKDERKTKAQLIAELNELRRGVGKSLQPISGLKQTGGGTDDTPHRRIKVSGIDIEWDISQGICTFEKLPVAMMWIDTTLMGVMSGMQKMVGPERFALALQAQGRESVEADWKVISQFPNFQDGFAAIANIAAVAGWGRWEIVTLEEKAKKIQFRISGGWEGLYQKKLGVNWSSALVAGKFAGYCSRLFGTNCWSEQVRFIADGDLYDEFTVRPSKRSIEREIESLLETDEATKADLAVAYRKLQIEIQERKEAEASLQKSEERFRSLVEASSDWIWEIDNKCRYTYASPNVRDLLGYDPQEMLKRTPFDFIVPESRENFKALCAELMRSGSPIKAVENRNLHKEGYQVVLETSGVPILDSNGELIGYRGIDRDITKRIQAEEERQALEKQIQHTQKLESLGVLAGGIAHDFSNLLMTILGNADLAKIELPSISPVKQNLEEIINTSHRAAELCRQMLAYSGKGRFLIEGFNLSEVVREMAHMLDISISKKAELKYNLADNLPPIEADATQVRQIIMNLITNASEALGNNPGIISISTGIMECTRSYLAGTYLNENLSAGSYVFLEVSDTGCGMDKETQSKIFDPFFTTKFTGRGLGMAASLGIIRGHKGAIRIRSKPGKGSTFTVLFPAGRRDTAPITESQTAKDAGKPGEGKILVVDDDASVCRIAKSMLEKSGYTVLTASDGRKALDVYREHTDEIRAVLLDLTMPRMDGEETFNELKKMNENIKVLMSSGYSEQEIAQRFADKGISGFIQKPYMSKDLIRKMKIILG